MTPKKLVQKYHNGSSFVKAFAKFGKNLENPEDLEYEEDISLEFLDNTTNRTSKTLRCVGYTLNLFSTTDFSRSMNSNVVLRTRHE